jgi:hypothetical protein
VDSNVSAWTFGSSILTFAFPMILFIVVAGALYVLYTKPEFVPGHRPDALERPVSYTPVPGKPTAARGTPAPATGTTAQATAAEQTQTPASAAEPAEPTAGEAAETGDAE